MTEAEIRVEQARLYSVYCNARDTGNRKAAQEAWEAANAFVAKHNPPKKAPGRSSRAGQRQAKEMRARYWPGFGK